VRTEIYHINKQTNLPSTKVLCIRGLNKTCQTSWSRLPKICVANLHLAAFQRLDVDHMVLSSRFWSVPPRCKLLCNFRHGQRNIGLRQTLDLPWGALWSTTFPREELLVGDGTRSLRSSSLDIMLQVRKTNCWASFYGSSTGVTWRRQLGCGSQELRCTV